MPVVPDTGPWNGLESLRDVLRTFLVRHCRDESEIDDVVQETFVRAARYRARLNDRSRLLPWTTRIALNVLADLRRVQRRTVGSLEAEGGLEQVESRGEAPGDGTEREYRIGTRVVGHGTALGILARVLPELREADRSLLASYYGGTRSCRTTAAECGVPHRLVKVRLFRARRRLLRRMRRAAALDGAPAQVAAVSQAS